MWEAIQGNIRRSRLLIGLMGAILVGLGALIGTVYAGAAEGGLVGALAALGIWLLLMAIALGGGEKILLGTSRAREIKKEDAPRLWNVVEEMTIASGLGKMPRVFVIDNDAPNAFATGRNPETGCVAVTSGLLRRLNRDELQGVIAHEIGHIRNYDIRFMTIAAVMVGSVALLSDVFLRSLWFGGGRRRGGGKGGGQAQLILLAVTIVAAILAPICTQLLYFACSRRREYLADASAARFTRYPPGLASALEKIGGSARSTKDVQRVMAPMYIVNPLQAAGPVGLFSTHPPIGKRVQILRSMGGNAGWMDYEAAYKKTVGGGSCLGERTLQSEGSIAARRPAPEPEPKRDAVERGREVADLLDRMVNFLLIGCACGVRIKVPPEFKGQSVTCTRCGRDNPIPRAEQAKEPQAAAGGGRAAESLRYRRKGGGWESFKCACGHTLQISPAFEGTSVRCKRCKRKTEIA